MLTRVFAGQLQDETVLRAPLVLEGTSQAHWRQFAGAAIKWMEGDYQKAADLARHCAASSLQSGLDEPAQPDAIRLAASAMEIEGDSLRRCERYDSAERIHRAAFELRRELGRVAEQIESAISLAACRQWTGDLAGAKQWLGCAAELIPEDQAAARQSAWALIRLSMILSAQSLHDEAILAARSAHETLKAFFPGEPSAWIANLHLSEAMIRQVEEVLEETNTTELFPIIAERLMQTQSELQAFGVGVASDLDWCRHQLDFLSRLQATVA